MDLLSLAAVAAPFVALAAVLAEIVAKKPSALAEFLRDSEAFARARVAVSAGARRDLIPSNDRTKLAA